MLNTSMLTHPLAPALALGLLAAGVAMLWPRKAHGRREDRRMHDHDNDRDNAPVCGARCGSTAGEHTGSLR